MSRYAIIIIIGCSIYPIVMLFNYLAFTIFGGVTANDFVIPLTGEYRLASTSTNNQLIDGPLRSMQIDSNTTNTTIWIMGRMQQMGWNDQIIICELIGDNISDKYVLANTNNSIRTWWVIDVKSRIRHGPIDETVARGLASNAGYDIKYMKSITEYHPSRYNVSK